MKTLFVLLLSFVVVVFAGSASAQWQTREIADSRMSDVAAVERLPSGEVVIFYNPRACSRLGRLVCGFVRAHEYGHVNMGHAITRRHRPTAEREADCWAAQYASEAEYRAAYDYFRSRGNEGDEVYGTFNRRAQRIAFCRRNR